MYITNEYVDDAWLVVRFVVLWYWSVLPIFMMTSSKGNIFHVTGPLCGEYTGHRKRPATRNFDVFFDRLLNKRLSKHSQGWSFETQSHSLGRHCNAAWNFRSYWDNEAKAKRIWVNKSCDSPRYWWHTNKQQRRRAKIVLGLMYMSLVLQWW